MPLFFSAFQDNEMSQSIIRLYPLDPLVMGTVACACFWDANPNLHFSAEKC